MFDTIVSNPPHYDHLTFEVVATMPLYLPKMATGLKLRRSRPKLGNFGDGWVFTGKVVNGGKTPAQFVRIEVTAWDAHHKLLGVERSYADDKLLEPGKSARYEVDAYMFPKHPATFEYAVWGQQK